MLVHNFLENSAARLPEKVALICDGQRLTYQQINHSADQLARYLIDIGVKRQDRVVIFLDNSAESVISLFGVLKAEAIFIILNPTMKSKKLNYILRDSGARALITHTNKARVIKDALSEVSELRHIVWCQRTPSSKIPQFNISESQLKTSGTWSSVFERVSTTSLPNYTIDIDLATIIYTSGSTGEPKGVMSAHYNVVAAASSIVQYLENVEDDIILDALPLSFDYGLYQVLMAFRFGGTVVLEKSFAYPYKVIEKIVQEKVTGLPSVPTIFAILLQLKNMEKYDFTHLRYITNTAAPLPVDYIVKLRQIFPHARIYSMYGLTECKRVTYLPPEKLKAKPESVGKAMPNTEAFIVDEQGNKITKPRVVGELVVQGPNVMVGYWNKPKETEEVIKPGNNLGDRWLYSGDLFTMDEDGDLYFFGRKDDMIKTAGEKVSPKEIENVLYEIEDVHEVGVIGVPDEILGQAIKAVVVLKRDSKLTENNIIQHCSNHLENFMVPKYVKFCQQLPKTSTGKICKKDLVYV